MTKPRPDQPGRCPSIDPHDTLQCTRAIHDDDQCRAGGIAWRKGSPRIEWDRERADRLQEEVEEYDAILGRQGDLLTRTVNALRGNPPPLTSWSHHDIPELAAEKVAEVALLIAERDALAAQVARVEALGEEWLAMDEANADYFSRERLDPTLAVRVATVRQEQLQAALADTEADTGEQEAGHRCEPYYSRAECGQCGWQEQWCVTCSRQMCGCATDAMGADQ
jgi:hypothetical protein